MHTQQTTLQVTMSDLESTRIVQNPLPSTGELGANQVVLEIEKFGFTANNITYAAIGERFGYWQFFPADSTWGIIPVWGIAKVLHSKCDEIEVGKRYYGYFPMSSHCVLEAGKIRGRGFTDVAAHRAELPAIYNNYTEVDAAFDGGDEDTQMIFRPLFTTSFVLDDFVAVEHFFEAKNIILPSASSKTGIGLAFLLQQRKAAQSESFHIIGLTSKKNVDFVNSLGYYDSVFVYEDVANLPLEDSCIVDFSGNTSLLYAIQEQLGNQLKYNCMVGLSHWDKNGGEAAKQLKGKVFFAPAYIPKRIKEWGVEGFQTRLKDAWTAFGEANKQALEIRHFEGIETVQSTYLNMLKGDISPKLGVVLKC